jgi:anti-anti-sigma factor
VALFTTITAVGGHAVVALHGVVDLSSVATLHADLSRAVRENPAATVVVDLDAVGGLDDVGLGVILGAAATARDGGGDLAVVCTRPALLDRLARTGFDRAVDVRSAIA